MKKPVLLMVLLMAVILTAMAASSLPGNGATKAALDTRLPRLSESVDLSSAKAAENQTENSTAPVTSSGAVKASFTVVESPAGGTPPAVSPATSGRPKSTRSTIPQRASADTEAGYQQTPTDQSSTPQSAGGLGGSAMGWILFFSIWSLEIVMVLGFAFVRGWARR